MAYPAATIAKWFIAWSEADETGEADLSNLKLQKLLYYAQGNYLATNEGNPLFDDRIEAWSHGPVIPAVYHEYKRFGRGAVCLERDDPFEWDDIDADTTQFLIDVWDRYGGLAPWKLRNMTHSEAPWVDTFRNDELHIEIPRESLLRYFSSL